MFDFAWQPHDDPETFVRERMQLMCERWRMFGTLRAEFTMEIAMMLRMLDVEGPLFVHFNEKQGNAVVDIATPLDEAFVQETIDEALRLLDAVRGQTSRKVVAPRLRLKRRARVKATVDRRVATDVLSEIGDAAKDR